MDVKEKVINTRNLIHSANNRGCWGALVNAMWNLWVPKTIELLSLLYKLKYVG